MNASSDISVRHACMETGTVYCVLLQHFPHQTGCLEIDLEHMNLDNVTLAFSLEWLF